MAGTESAVAVKGLSELVRAFDKMQGKAQSEVRAELVRVGEPVKSAAEHLAVANVRNIGEDWSRMRLGITSTLVYVAPAMRSRRKGRRRPKFGTLLLERAMLPAVRGKEPQVIAAIDHALDRLAGIGGFE